MLSQEPFLISRLHFALGLFFSTSCGVLTLHAEFLNHHIAVLVVLSILSVVKEESFILSAAHIVLLLGSLFKHARGVLGVAASDFGVTAILARRLSSAISVTTSDTCTTC